MGRLMLLFLVVTLMVFISQAAKVPKVSLLFKNDTVFFLLRVILQEQNGLANRLAELLSL